MSTKSAPTQAPFDALADPVVRAAVDRAMEPYRDLLKPEAFEEMREDLADFLVMHPVTERLTRRLRERTNLKSGAEAKDGAVAREIEEHPAERAARRKGA